MRQFIKALLVGTALLLTSCEESKHKEQEAPVVEAQKAPGKEEPVEAEAPKVEEPKKGEEVTPPSEVQKPEPQPKEEPKPEEPKAEEPAPEKPAEAKSEEPAKEAVPQVEGKPEVPAPKASKETEGEKKAPTAKAQNDEDIVKQQIEELKVMQPGPKFVQWIQTHGATFMMAKRVFGRDINRSSDELDKHFSKTFAQFVSANIATFLPLIADYDIRKVTVAQAGKSLKKFTLHLRERKTGEDTVVNVIVTNKNLRIVDITVQETSLVSILKTAAQDILSSPKDKQKEAWDKLIGLGK